MTAELALAGQNADRDRDILTALRMHVSEPVSRQVERLDLLVAELGGVAHKAAADAARRNRMKKPSNQPSRVADDAGECSRR